MLRTELENEISASRENSKSRSIFSSTAEYEFAVEPNCWKLNCCCKTETHIHHLPMEVLQRKSILMTCPNCLACIRTQLKYLKLIPRKKFRKLAHILRPLSSCILCNRFRKIIHICPICSIALGMSNVFDCF